MQRLRIEHVAVDDLHRQTIQSGEIAGLAQQYPHLTSMLHQQSDDMAADKSTRAGDQHRFRTGPGHHWVKSICRRVNLLVAIFHSPARFT